MKLKALLKLVWPYSEQRYLPSLTVIEESVPCNFFNSDEIEHCISESSDWKSTGGDPEWIHSPGCQNRSGDSSTVVTLV